MKTRLYKLFCLDPVLVMVVAAVLLSGCLESSFDLAADSRLPVWIDVPDGLSRTDIKVTMDYYSGFSGGEIVFKSYKSDDFFPYQKITVDDEMVKEIAVGNAPQGLMNYPAYYAVTVENRVDIVEHRKMEPFFYMSDDAAVWQEIGIRRN